MSISEDVNDFAMKFYKDPDGLLQFLLALCKKKTLLRISPCPTYPTEITTPDLRGRVQLFTRLAKAKEQDPATILARLFERALHVEYKKSTGIYFTSPKLADFTVGLLNVRPNETIVDAGCGTGVFAAKIYKALGEKRARQVDYVGIEVDSFLALATAISLDMLMAPINWRVLYSNFLSIDREYLASSHVPPVTAIVSNPPFVRSRRISNRSKLVKSIRRRTGYDLTGMAGLHSFFLAQASSLLGPGGRMVFLLPSEMSNVNYGSILENQLRLQFDVQKLDIWTTLENNSDALRWLYRFSPRQRRQETFLSTSPILASQKYRLISIARVHRGISTGCNAFFTLTERQAKELKIPSEYLQRIIPTRIRLPVDTSILTEDYWSQLKKLDYACWLLAIPEQKTETELPVTLQHHLRVGVRQMIHKIPTCQSRDPWYSIRISKAPDFIFTYISRQPRFFYNEVRAHVLTNLLGVYMRTSSRMALAGARLVRSLNTELQTWLGSGAFGRVYAGGLRKFEPSDLEHMPISLATLNMIPDITSLASFFDKPLDVGVVQGGDEA